MTIIKIGYASVNMHLIFTSSKHDINNRFIHRHKSPTNKITSSTHHVELVYANIHLI